MSGEIIAGSIASATAADLMLADLYIGPVTWIGERGDGDAIKVVFERVDGSFEAFALGDLQRCTWWRLGKPEHVVALEALMQPAPQAGEAQLERRKEAIRAEQASARARLAVA